MDLHRQLDIFKPSENTEITIIGAGSIGSWVALGLAKTGFRKISVWDGDIVKDHNIPNQFYKSILENKAELLRQELGNTIIAIPMFWNGEIINSDIIVIAVDNMEVRKKIVESQNVPFIIDGRIGGENIRVLSVSIIDYESKKYYLESWYPDSEAEELPCTGRTILDVGFFVSGIICNRIRRFLKDGIITREIVMDVKTLDLLKIEKK